MNLKRHKKIVTLAVALTDTIPQSCRFAHPTLRGTRARAFGLWCKFSTPIRVSMGKIAGITSIGRAFLLVDRCVIRGQHKVAAVVSLEFGMTSHAH